MDAKIFACAKMLEIETQDLFVRAYNSEHGLIFGLREPVEVHRRWKKGICSAPPYVTAFVNKIVATLH